MKKTLRMLVVLTLVLSLILGFMSVAEAKAATRIAMSRRTLSMDWGTRYQLAVTVSPSNASDKNAIQWSKTDPDSVVESLVPDASTRKAWVTVRNKVGGEAYPLTPVYIIATTSTGRKATCTITLKQVLVKSISVSPSSKTVYLTPSQPTYKMNPPTFNPAVAGDRVSYTWSSNNNNVATVDPDGTVHFVGEGTARIIATYQSGTVTTSDDCKFTVKPVRVKSFSLSETTHYMGQNENFTLAPKVTSSVGSLAPSYGKVTWKSADESIAKVDEHGVVTAQGKSGIVKITASVDVAPYTRTADCLVYVRDSNPVKVTITAGGDCVLGGDPRTTGITARSSQRNYEKLTAANGPLYPFARVQKLFAPTGATGLENLSIVNVEVCLTTKGGSNPKTDRKFLFRGDPGNAKALKEAEIDVANIANNHSADFGGSSFSNTANSIINAFGGDRNSVSGYLRGGPNYVPVKEVGGRRVGFYGFQASQLPLSMVASRIQKVKSDNHLDMLVVTIHWTGQLENVRPATSAMKAYARKAIDSGADLVIGHHRHVSSGIERYKGKYILYDMGNFVTGGAASPYTYAVQIDFDISGSFAESAANAIRIYPLYTTSDAGYKWTGKKYERQSNNWQPVPASEAIDHLDSVTAAPAPDPNVVSGVISIINSNSPSGPDGKFSANNYIHSYSELP